MRDQSASSASHVPASAGSERRKASHCARPGNASSTSRGHMLALGAGNLRRAQRVNACSRSGAASRWNCALPYVCSEPGNLSHTWIAASGTSSDAATCGSTTSPCSASVLFASRAAMSASTF
eukprot:7387897-Prymnesium_polylepis.1